MKYDFNDNIDLRSADSKRYNTYPSEVLPLWIADMDFALAEPIVRTLQNHIANYPLIYSSIGDKYNRIVCDYIESRFGWQIEPQWLVWTIGVVPGIHASIRAHVDKHSNVIVPKPVYPPFFSAAAEREVRFALMELEDNKWQWRLPERSDADAMLVACHPHNPTGKVFDRSELEKIADYCCDNNLLLCSDEIYADLILDDIQHIPLASLNHDIAKRSITLMSAGKTWNISGLATAFAVIPDDVLRSGFRKALSGISSEPTLLGVKASCAAFVHGHEWREQMLQHLRNNRALIEQKLADIAGIQWIKNQATFLAWIRCTQQPAETVWTRLYESGLALSSGQPFGDSEYLRFNYGCTSSNLNKAIQIMEQVLNE